MALQQSRQNRISPEQYLAAEPVSEIKHEHIAGAVCRRNEYSEHYYLGDEVHFAAVDLRLPVETLYARVIHEDMRVFLKTTSETA